mgnify:CR=1 FL=1
MSLRTNHILVAAVLAIVQWSCGNSMLDRRLDEGVIEYDLSFPDYDPNGLMAGMLPEKTTLTFTENKQVAELSAGMGLFRTSMIADNDERKLDYQLSVLSKKLVAHLQQRDMLIFNKGSIAMTILRTEETDTIAGYPCHKAVAIFNSIDQPEIELWYTDRINMEDPNWFGPFADVPGVLMRYEVVQYGMRMRLDAVAVEPGPIDPTKFKVRPDHRQVTPDVLNNELQELLGTFTL